MTLFFELIQAATGRCESLSRIPSAKEWQMMYGLSVKQALAGVCFAAVERLPKDSLRDMPTHIKLQWFALAKQIKRRNVLVNARASELQKILAGDGFRACVLKGQGVALLYNLDINLYKNSSLGLYRQSGDIDVWVDGEREEVIRYVKAHYKCGRAVIHHIDVEVFDDVPVEVHFIPSYAYSWLRYRAYKRFFNEYKKEYFVQSGLGFCMPSLGFNVVYLLMHIFRHVFHEGIGLRQLMDYYFLLLSFHRTHGEHERTNVKRWLRELGLLRFAGAVMFVERDVFGLPKEGMICEPDEEAGRFLLDEILHAGNFGQYDPRIREAHSGGLLKLYLNSLRRIFRMVKFYPSEVLWAPFWKAGHFVWRKGKGF